MFQAAKPKDAVSTSVYNIFLQFSLVTLFLSGHDLFSNWIMKHELFLQSFNMIRQKMQPQEFDKILIQIDLVI